MGRGNCVNVITCSGFNGAGEEMKKTILLALSVVVSSTAFGQNLFSNQSSNVNVAALNAVATSGSGVAAPAGGFWSECQTDGSGFANTNAGFGYTGALRLADDFTVTGAGWNLTGMKIYSYLTGGTANPLTGGSLNIWSGRPGDTGAAIIGTGTFNTTGATDIIRVNAAGTTGNIFRVFNTTIPATVGGTATPPGTTRRVWENSFSISMTLAPGTYWVDVAGVGGGFMPGTTHQGLRGVTGANGRQFNGSWVDLTDLGQPTGGPAFAQDIPFVLQGTVVPEPASMAALSLGALALIRRRRNKKA